MKRALLALLLAAALPGCPRREAKSSPPPDPVVGELHIAFLIPPSFDAALDVALWRISVHTSAGALVTSADVADGEPLRLDNLEPQSGVYVRLQSFDDTSARLGIGRTVLLDLTPEAADAEMYFAPPESLLEVSGNEAGRSFAAVLPLSDGNVLIAGGVDGDPSNGADDTELYDPRTNTVTDLPNLPVVQRFPAAFSPAPDVLVIAGGLDDAGDALDITQIFRWNAAASAGTWTVGATLSEPRADAAAVALGDGRTLLVAGTSGSGFLASTDLFAWDGAAGTWTPGPVSGLARASAVAFPLGGGRALVAGGRNNGGALDNVQVYLSDPVGGDTLAGAAGDNLRTGRGSPGVLPLSATSWLILGGVTGAGVPRVSTETLVWDEALDRVDTADAADLPSPRWGGRSGQLADGRFVFVGGSAGAAPYDVAGLDEVLLYEGGLLTDLGVDTGEPTVTCTIVPLDDGTSLFVTDDDVLRYNPAVAP